MPCRAHANVFDLIRVGSLRVLDMVAGGSQPEVKKRGRQHKRSRQYVRPPALFLFCCLHFLGGRGACCSGGRGRGACCSCGGSRFASSPAHVRRGT